MRCLYDPNCLKKVFSSNIKRISKIWKVLTSVIIRLIQCLCLVLSNQDETPLIFMPTFSESSFFVSVFGQGFSSKASVKIRFCFESKWRQFFGGTTISVSVLSSISGSTTSSISLSSSILQFLQETQAWRRHAGEKLCEMKVRGLQLFDQPDAYQDYAPVFRGGG